MPNLTTAVTERSEVRDTTSEAVGAEPATRQAASISETEAAKRLNVIPATLRTWRLKGLLADGLVTETPSPAPGGRARIRYDANWIADYAENGEANRDMFKDVEGVEWRSSPHQV